MHDPAILQLLMARGVVIPRPEAVEIDASVVPERLAKGVVIHVGCKLAGASTSVGPGCVLGAEAPAAVVDCQLGRGVRLAGGSFEGATFLDGASVGSGAQVRPGTLLEEQASCAHTVGLKQTILMPYVTLGSLINFCDALMAGGTSRKDHSEVGSSYIHFNFTPHQDKATASLIGDVPRGVMLDQPAIFLGGQGGLVGPARIAFGTVIAAGVIQRKDVLAPGLLITGGASRGGSAPFEQGLYRRIQRVVRNNLCYLGNLLALRAWYQEARQLFMQRDPFDRACYQGALGRLEAALSERHQRLGQLADKLEASIVRLEAAGGDPVAVAEQRAFVTAWPGLAASLEAAVAAASPPPPRTLVSALGRVTAGAGFLDALRHVDAQARADASAWLQAMVDAVVAPWDAIAASLR